MGSPSCADMTWHWGGGSVIFLPRVRGNTRSSMKHIEQRQEGEFGTCGGLGDLWKRGRILETRDDWGGVDSIAGQAQAILVLSKKWYDASTHHQAFMPHSTSPEKQPWSMCQQINKIRCRVEIKKCCCIPASDRHDLFGRSSVWATGLKWHMAEQPHVHIQVRITKNGMWIHYVWVNNYRLSRTP